MWLCLLFGIIVASLKEGDMSIAIVAFTKKGALVAQQIARELDADVTVAPPLTKECCLPAYETLATWTKYAWDHYKHLVFVGACGIAVRAIAPHVTDKFSDPSVVVLDEKATFVVPLLSGHVGGANELAIQIASLVAAQPVISTATDLNGLFAVDVWAQKQKLHLSDRDLARYVSASILSGKKIHIESDFDITGDIPLELSGDKDSSVCIYITCHAEPTDSLRLIPQVLHVGIGCRRGKEVDDIESFVREVLNEYKLDMRAVASVRSIDIKKDEQGIVEFCEKHELPFVTHASEELASVEGDFAESIFVKNTVGVGNVCERAAAMAAPRILVKKRTGDGIALAISCEYVSFCFDESGK